MQQQLLLFYVSEISFILGIILFIFILSCSYNTFAYSDHDNHDKIYCISKANSQFYTINDLDID